METYGAYFAPSTQNSHFILGCVLNFKGKINFLGIYYSATPTKINNFVQDKIDFVDPNDNVALEIGGRQQTFLAVRQFVSKSIPARYADRVANCDRPNTSDFSIEKKDSTVDALKQGSVKFCNDGFCANNKYLEFFGKYSFDTIYNFDNIILIDGSGYLLIQSPFLENACSKWKGSSPSIYNFVYERCPVRE